MQAIFGFWRCENTEYLFRKYVEYLPNFRANFQKQFSGESAVDADWRGEGAVNCGWKTGGKLEVRSLTPQIHPVVQRNMEINFYFTLYRQWTRLSKWNWVWNCWCSCSWHRACLCGSTVSSLNNRHAIFELLFVQCLRNLSPDGRLLMKALFFTKLRLHWVSDLCNGRVAHIFSDLLSDKSQFELRAGWQHNKKKFPFVIAMHWQDGHWFCALKAFPFIKLFHGIIIICLIDVDCWNIWFTVKLCFLEIQPISCKCNDTF